MEQFTSARGGLCAHARDVPAVAPTVLANVGLWSGDTLMGEERNQGRKRAPLPVHAAHHL